MDCCKKLQALIDQGRSHIGMMSEARSKCLLLEEKINFFNDFDCPEEYFSYFSAQLMQIRDDINTYSEQLCTIREKLRSYGAFSGLE
jgi:hypothetical protein